MATTRNAPDAADLSDQIAALKNDISAITKTLSEMGAAQRDAAVHNVREKAETLRDEGQRTVEYAQGRAEEMGQQTVDAIRRQPAAAVGVAVAVGFIAGMLTGRK
jgi:ElaB/YqjD/DUF883 family membrane-anchored ribosome-binding protein